jgi:cell division protein FtsI (penicillin-binding protein 3)
MLVLAIAISGRILYIQFIEGDEYREMSDQTSIREFKIEAVRGNIYSDDNSLLATSVPEYDLYWDASTVYNNLGYEYFNNHIDSLAYYYTRIFPDETAIYFKTRMKNAFKSRKQYYLIRRKVSYKDLKSIEKLPIFKLGQYKGGMIAEKYDIRKRPYKMLAKRTIGIYHRSMDKYVVGLEGAYNDVLKGEDGVRIKQKTAGGWRPLYLFDETLKKPKHGSSIVSTIDVNIQDVTENSLYQHLEQHNAEWGCAVLMEVKTGHIKAIANLTYNPNTKKYEESFNHAVGTGVEPGSTFKTASILIALDDKKVKPSDSIETGKGRMKYYGKWMSDSHEGGFGTISVKEVIEKSSNVGVFDIIIKAYEDDPQKFIDKLYQIGLNKKLGIEIKGESEPYIKNTSDETWSKLSLPWMSIGYELKLNALQLLSFYNAIANDGVMVKPMFVKEITKTGSTIKKFDTQILNNSIASPEAISQIQEMLEGVITDGTASLLKNSPLKIAGKTGTAQIYNQSYNKTDYRASFIGYFPADNPLYSCVVIVNKPSTGVYYASQVAVPVFKEIANKVYANELDYHEEKADRDSVVYPNSKLANKEDILKIYNYLEVPIDTPSDNAFWLQAVNKNQKVGFYYRETEQDRIPNVVGMNAKDAIYMLESLGLSVVINGKGEVVEQSIQPNTKLIKGDLIRLKLAAI